MNMKVRSYKGFGVPPFRLVIAALAIVAVISATVWLWPAVKTSSPITSRTAGLSVATIGGKWRKSPQKITRSPAMPGGAGCTRGPRTPQRDRCPCYQ